MIGHPCTQPKEGSDADYEPEENGQILKCGVNRVWVDPRYIDKLAVQFRSLMYAN